MKGRNSSKEGDRVHPGRYISEELKSRGRTQKQFSDLIGKKVSEVNELINGKRNITIVWDVLLSLAFDDPEGKRIQMQNDYDFEIFKLHADHKKLNEIKRKRHLASKENVFERF